MIARGGGYLLNTASAAGLLSQIGSATYAVTKHAAVSLAEWIAITHGHQGIKVSVLCPQAVRTDMIAGNEGDVASVNGIMEPEQVADAVVAGLAAEKFLILPHAEVAEYMQRKAADRDRWIAGMNRLQQRYRERRVTSAEHSPTSANTRSMCTGQFRLVFSRHPHAADPRVYAYRRLCVRSMSASVSAGRSARSRLISSTNASGGTAGLQ